MKRTVSIANINQSDTFVTLAFVCALVCKENKQEKENASMYADVLTRMLGSYLGVCLHGVADLE